MNFVFKMLMSRKTKEENLNADKKSEIGTQESMEMFP